MARTTKTTKKDENQPTLTDELLVLGHLIKYNLYLLYKAQLFAVVSKYTKTLEESVTLANKMALELDLDAKRRLDENQTSE